MHGAGARGSPGPSVQDQRLAQNVFFSRGRFIRLRAAVDLRAGDHRDAVQNVQLGSPGLPVAEAHLLCRAS